MSFTQEIDALFETDNYTVEFLVSGARNLVQQNLGFLHSAESELVMANFTCEQTNCQLQRLHVYIYRKEKCRCLFSDPFKASLTIFTFNMEESTVTAHTYYTGFVTYPIQWENLPKNINEVMEIAFDLAGPEFFEQNTFFELNIALQRDYWNVIFANDVGFIVQFRIGYDGSLVNE